MLMLADEIGKLEYERLCNMSDHARRGVNKTNNENRHASSGSNTYIDPNPSATVGRASSTSASAGCVPNLPDGPKEEVAKALPTGNRQSSKTSQPAMSVKDNGECGINERDHRPDSNDGWVNIASSEEEDRKTDNQGHSRRINEGDASSHQRRQSKSVHWEEDEGEVSMQEIEERKIIEAADLVKQNHETRERLKAALVSKGYSEEIIKETLRTHHARIELSRPTYIKVHRNHLSPDTLDCYGLPWEWEDVGNHTVS